MFGDVMKTGSRRNLRMPVAARTLSSRCTFSALFFRLTTFSSCRRPSASGRETRPAAFSSRLRSVSGMSARKERSATIFSSRSAAARKRSRRELLTSGQRGHVDHEPVAHIALQKAFVRLVDGRDVDQLYVGGDPVFRAVVQHLLRLGNAADARTSQAAPAAYQVEHRHFGGRGWRAHADHHAIGSEQVEIKVVIVLRRDGVDDEVEISSQLLELRGIARERELLRSQTSRVLFLCGRRAEHRHLRAKRSAEDRKSTRLNSSHSSISYAVFCLKKKKKIITNIIFQKKKNKIQQH